MGRGRSKLSQNEIIRRSGVDTDTREGQGNTTKTAILVDGINNVRNAGVGKEEVKVLLNDINPGQKISTYTSSVGKDTVRGMSALNEARNITVWTKQKDGTWKSDNGDRRDVNAMANGLVNSPRVLAPGKVSTESHVKITGKPGKEYNGLRYAKGTYDVLQTGNIPRMGAMKREKEGMITTYRGTKYGVTRVKGGGYKVTHIPSGTLTNYNTGRNLKTYNEVSDHIKSIDKMIREKRAGQLIKEQEAAFKRTIRGD